MDESVALVFPLLLAVAMPALFVAVAGS